MANDATVRDGEEASLKENVESQVPETQPTTEADVDETGGEEAQPQKVDATDEMTPEQIRALRGKVSALEKRANESSQKAQALDSLAQIIETSPELKKSYFATMVKLGRIQREDVPTGVLDDDEETRPEAKAETQSPTALPPHYAALMEELSREKARKLSEENAFVEKFEEERPDILDGTPEQVAIKKQAIGAHAALLMTNDKSLSKQDALVKAYNYVLHPERQKEEGELEGLAQAQQTRSVVGASAGYSPKTTPGGAVSEEQSIANRLFGIKDDSITEDLRSAESLDDYKKIRGKR